ncbi:MAG TPA: DUF4118 domain-containing protein [Candidatus Merdisoma faecalis]|nr:DUF4118 domain-containing protein [Candidatus Merdisoma faecalis]
MTNTELKRNCLITILALLLATLIAYLFYLATGSANNISMIYVLAVALIARYSSGYLPGILASVISVFIVNAVFTYPYGKLNFTMAGYPLTFLGFLSVSIITSTTTTHLKSQARQIQEQERLLLEADKEKMRANLLRAISHDLRTPLTAIIGSSSTYLENGEDLSEKERNALVSGIHEDAHWLLNMVENLLTVTRIDADTASVVKTEEPVEEVVAEAVTRLKQRLPDISVKARVPDEFYLIPMDATLIEQVIINLLENAARHSGSSDPIELNVWPNGNMMQFDVIDYGKGIAPERLSSIFDGDAAYSREGSSEAFKGMGIGLSICKTIISAHKGTITAENHGKGAKFSFTLPM